MMFPLQLKSDKSMICVGCSQIKVIDDLRMSAVWLPGQRDSNMVNAMLTLAIAMCPSEPLTSVHRGGRRKEELKGREELSEGMGVGCSGKTRAHWH